MSRKTNFETFGLQLDERAQDLAVMLPSHVTPERFRAVCIATVKETPAILDATPRSLFSAVTRAAQDGLLPDGREGTIQVYNTKVKVGKDFHWEKQAQWLPMIFGLRKRARELEGMLVTAEIVHENDDFDLVLGDHPSLTHKPAKLGMPRGSALGTYAIYRARDGHIIHREIMSAEQIEAVRKKSRAPDGMLWKDFWDQAWRKTVARRGFKTIPVGQELDRIVSRDDAHFTFDGEVEELEERPALPPRVGAAERRRTAGGAEVVTGKRQDLPEKLSEREPPVDTFDPDEAGEPAETESEETDEQPGPDPEGTEDADASHTDPDPNTSPLTESDIRTMIASCRSLDAVPEIQDLIREFPRSMQEELNAELAKRERVIQKVAGQVPAGPGK